MSRIDLALLRVSAHQRPGWAGGREERRRVVAHGDDASEEREPNCPWQLVGVERLAGGHRAVLLDVVRSYHRGSCVAGFVAARRLSRFRVIGSGRKFVSRTTGTAVVSACLRKRRFRPIRGG
jgi:hypothetical protein